MSLEIKKLKLDVLRLDTAKAELEYKIDELNEDIERVKNHIALNEKRRAELEEKINNLEKGV